MFTLLASALAVSVTPGFKSGELNVYIQRTSKNTVNVLKLYPDNTYNYCRYTKLRIARDSGTYQMRGCKIKMKSCLKKKGSNPFLKEPGFVGKRGIYKDRLPRVFAGKPDFYSNSEEKYLSVWNYNPITHTFFEHSDQKQPEKLIARSSQLTTEKLRQDYAKAKAFFLAKGDFYGEYGQQLRKAYCGPGDYLSYPSGVYKPWDGNTDETRLLGKMHVVIHESIHRFNSSNRMLVVPGLEIDLEQHPIFRSADFAGLVPDELEQRIFRYQTYVSDTSTVSANVSGIYGLLDEYSAYMNGTRFSLIAAEKLLALGNIEEAFERMRDASQCYYAYYEFRLFVAWYLQYAEKYNKDVHQHLMNHRNMRVLFTLLDDEFLETIRRCEQLKFPDNKHSWAKEISYFEKKYATPCKDALVQQEDRLKNFKIEGVNKLNYKSFTKELETL